MIVVDTNVISEPVKPDPEPAVIEWLDRQAVETLYLTTMSLAELRHGIAALPAGQRKDSITADVERQISMHFGRRILDFDNTASQAYGDIRALTDTKGMRLGVADAIIAAISLVHGFHVATRDTEPFEAAGLSVINPWQTP